jgi:hypothetical protein
VERRLSSQATFAYKFLVVPVWIAAVGGGLMARGSALPFWVLWVVIGAGLAWVLSGVKQVALRDSSLLVSNFRRTVEISLADVESVSPRPLNPPRILLRLRRPSELGDEIVFIPAKRSGSGHRGVDLVEELRERVRTATGVAAPLRPQG